MYKQFKQWFKSKTIWFSTFGVPAIMSLMVIAQESLPIVKANLGASYAVTSFVLTICIAWLRARTTKPLEEK